MRVSVGARVDCAEALGALLRRCAAPGETPGLPTLLSLLSSTYASQVQVRGQRALGPRSDPEWVWLIRQAWHRPCCVVVPWACVPLCFALFVPHDMCPSFAFLFPVPCLFSWCLVHVPCPGRWLASSSTSAADPLSHWQTPESPPSPLPSAPQAGLPRLWRLSLRSSTKCCPCPRQGPYLQQGARCQGRNPVTAPGVQAGSKGGWVQGGCLRRCGGRWRRCRGRRWPCWGEHGR